MFQRLALAAGQGWFRFVKMVDKVLTRREDMLQLPLLDGEEAARELMEALRMIVRNGAYGFAVGSKYGPRSYKWIVSHDNDLVMISPEQQRKHWSVHWHIQTNQSHVKNFHPALQAAAGGPYRIRGSLLPAQSVTRDCEVGVTVIIPSQCLRPASFVEDWHPQGATRLEGDQWIAVPANETECVEIAIAVCPAAAFGNEERPVCPRQFGPESILQAVTVHGPGITHRLAVVSHTIEIPDDIKEVIAMLPTSPGPLLDSPERRCVVQLRRTSGTIILIEHAVD